MFLNSLLLNENNIFLSEKPKKNMCWFLISLKIFFRKDVGDFDTVISSMEKLFTDVSSILEEDLKVLFYFISKGAETNLYTFRYWLFSESLQICFCILYFPED